MRRFVEGIDREQATLFPECLEDWIDQDNPVQMQSDLEMSTHVARKYLSGQIT
jgi:hypothetical protein